MSYRYIEQGYLPLKVDLELQLNGVVLLFYGDNFKQGQLHVHFSWLQSCDLATGYGTKRGNSLIVALFQDKYFAIEFIRLILTIRYLVTSFLHHDALTIGTSKLCVLTPGQCHLKSMFFALRTLVVVTGYCPVVFAKCK